jgi:hypothetical protein
MVRFTVRINWKDVLKFLSGAFFVTAGGELAFIMVSHQVPVPFFGLTMTPEFLRIRGFHTLRVVSDLLLLWVHIEVRRRNPSYRVGRGAHPQWHPGSSLALSPEMEGFEKRKGNRSRPFCRESRALRRRETLKLMWAFVISAFRQISR